MKFSFSDIIIGLVGILFSVVLCIAIYQLKSNAKYLLYLFGGLTVIAIIMGKKTFIKISLGLLSAVMVYIVMTI